jgi:hypothetical protein
MVTSEYWILGPNIAKARVRRPNCRGRLIHYARMNATTTGYMLSYLPTLPHQRSAKPTYGDHSSCRVQDAREVWGGSGVAEWPKRLVMIILELPRHAFSCMGCNSNQLEASWRPNLFLLFTFVRPLRSQRGTAVALWYIIEHTGDPMTSPPKPIGAADDCIPRFRGGKYALECICQFEPEVGQLRACRLHLES